MEVDGVSVVVGLVSQGSASCSPSISGYTDFVNVQAPKAKVFLDKFPTINRYQYAPPPPPTPAPTPVVVAPTPLPTKVPAVLSSSQCAEVLKIFNTVSRLRITTNDSLSGLKKCTRIFGNKLLRLSLTLGGEIARVVDNAAIRKSLLLS
jgi:hypothetical protein